MGLRRAGARPLHPFIVDCPPTARPAPQACVAGLRRYPAISPCALLKTNGCRGLAPAHRRPSCFSLFPNTESAKNPIQHIIHPNPPGNAPKGVGGAAQGFGTQNGLRRQGGVAQRKLRIGKRGPVAGVGQ